MSLLTSSDSLSQSPFSILRVLYQKEKNTKDQPSMHLMHSRGGFGKVFKSLPLGVCLFSLKSGLPTFLPCLTGPQTVLRMQQVLVVPAAKPTLFQLQSNPIHRIQFPLSDSRIFFFGHNLF